MDRERKRGVSLNCFVGGSQVGLTAYDRI